MRYNAAAFFGVYGTCLLSILVAQVRCLPACLPACLTD